MNIIRHRFFVVITAISLAVGAGAQSNIDPGANVKPVEALMHRLFALSKAKQLGSPEGQKLRSGEMAKGQMTTFGAIPDPDKIIMLHQDAAVVRIPAMGQQPDLYLFVARNSTMETWTWTTYRSLALTGMLEYLRDALRKKAALTTTEGTTLRNLELTLSSDKQLIAWFTAHHSELEAIRARTRPSKPINRSDRNADGRRLVGLGLLLSTLKDGAVSITIGGMVDNEVGYMYAPSGKVPEISSDHYIWIEPLGGDWYLYKTT